VVRDFALRIGEKMAVWIAGGKKHKARTTFEEMCAGRGPAVLAWSNGLSISADFPFPAKGKRYIMNSILAGSPGPTQVNLLPTAAAFGNQARTFRLKLNAMPRR